MLNNNPNVNNNSPILNQKKIALTMVGNKNQIKGKDNKNPKNNKIKQLLIEVSNHNKINPEVSDHNFGKNEVISVNRDNNKITYLVLEEIKCQLSMSKKKQNNQILPAFDLISNREKTTVHSINHNDHEIDNPKNYNKANNKTHNKISSHHNNLRTLDFSSHNNLKTRDCSSHNSSKIINQYRIKNLKYLKQKDATTKNRWENSKKQNRRGDKRN